MRLILNSLIIRLLTFVFFSSFLLSCSEHDDFKDYRLFIKNESDSELNIITYKNNIETNNITISSNQRGLECVYNESFFNGYDCIDSIIFIFPNNKGYRCGYTNQGSFCFGSQISPWFFNEKFIKKSGNIYEFTITKQDYENAHKLP